MVYELFYLLVLKKGNWRLQINYGEVAAIFAKKLWEKWGQIRTWWSTVWNCIPVASCGGRGWLGGWWSLVGSALDISTEGRAWLSRSDSEFSFLWVSLILHLCNSSWVSTTLSENPALNSLKMRHSGDTSNCLHYVNQSKENR